MSIFLSPAQKTFLGEARGYMILSAVLFLLGGIIGYLSGIFAPNQIEEVRSSLEGYGEVFNNYTTIQIFFYILLNNTLVLLGVMLLSVLAGVVAAVFSLTQGFLIGVIVFLTIGTHSVAAILIGILPHGVFELPALFITLGIGFLLGRWFLQRLGGKRATPITADLRRAFELFAVVIFPLLIIAAAIEAFFTPELLASYLNVI